MHWPARALLGSLLATVAAANPNAADAAQQAAAAAPVAAQAQPPVEAALPATNAPVAELQEAITARTNAIAANATLSATDRQGAQATLAEAENQLQAAIADQAETARLVAQRLAAPGVLAQLAQGAEPLSSSVLTPGWSDGALAQLEVVLAESDAAARSALQRAAQLRSQIADVQNAVPLIGPELADARQSLATVRSAIAQARAAGPASAGQRDARLLAQAQEQALLAHIALLEEQRNGAELRTQLLTAEAAQADREANLLQANLAEVRAVVARRRLSDAVEASSDWQQTAVGHYPEIVRLAGVNRELADMYVGQSAVTHDTDSARARLAAIDAAIAEFDTDTQSLHNRLKVLGRSTAAGVLVREAIKGLPRIEADRQEVSRRQSVLEDAQMRIVELNGERQRLERDFDGVTAQAVDAIRGLPAGERAQATEVVGALLRSRSKILEPLVQDLEAYVAVLSQLQSQERDYIASVRDAADELRAQESWVRNARPVSRADVSRAFAGLAELGAPELWSGGWASLLAALRAGPWIAVWTLLVILGGAALLVWLQPTERRGVPTFRGRFTRYTLFVRAGLSGVACVAIVTAIGRWLSGIENLPPGLREFGESLMDVRAGAFAVGLLAGLFAARYGLADLRPDLRSLTERLRDSVVPLTVVLLLTVASRLLFVAEIEGASQDADLAARLCLLVSAGLIGWIIHRVAGLRLRQAAVASGRTISLVWGGIYLAAMIVPLMFVLLLLEGFLVGAWELTRSLLATLLVLTLVATMRAAFVAVRTEPGAGQHDADVALRIGRSRLLQLTVGVVGIAVMVWIWRDVILALGYLQNIALWTTETSGGMRTVTVANLLACIAVFAGTLLAFWALPLLAGTQSIDTTSRGVGTRYAVVTLVRYFILLVGVLGAFALLNIGWSKIQWLATGLSVGLGFGLQEIVANFFSGLILLSERSIRVGDLVAIGDRTGVVSRIHVRATTIRDFDGREILIPNKEMLATEVTNWTLSNTRRRLHVEVGVAYGSDTALVERLLIEAAHQVPEVLEVPAPSVAFEEFGDSALQFRLYAWIAAAERAVPVGHQLHVRIEEVLRRNGVTIPFPQRDLHVVSGTVPPA
jgi:potassium efflux system protein